MNFILVKKKQNTGGRRVREHGIDDYSCASSGKEPCCNAGDVRDSGLIPGSRRSPGGGHSNPLQYSCLENPIDRRAWWAVVHRSQRVEYN